jgi:hypothetical protein
VRLWIDSSVARQPGALRELTELAKRCDVEVVVHPHVHLELCRNFRCKYGSQFVPSIIDSYLKNQRISIPTVHLDQVVAERWAERLHRRYSTVDGWEEAKRSTLRGTLRSDFVHEPGKMPMTTDWWVALQVEESDNDRIVVEDTGGEWVPLRTMGRAMTAETAKQWLMSVSG